MRHATTRAPVRERSERLQPERAVLRFGVGVLELEDAETVEGLADARA